MHPCAQFRYGYCTFFRFRDVAAGAYILWLVTTWKFAHVSTEERGAAIAIRPAAMETESHEMTCGGGKYSYLSSDLALWPELIERHAIFQ